VSAHHYAVTVADLERGPKEVHWDLPIEWLTQALADTNATPLGAGTIQAHLSLNGREVLVRGRIAVSVSMPCVRTLKPVEIALEPEMFLLLDPPAQPASTLKRRGRPESQGPTRQRKHQSMDTTNDTKGWERDPGLADHDAARDTYDGEKVVLDPFIREFIVLELPMAPRRSDLPSTPDAATTPAPQGPGSANGPSVDPRLAPLAEIASRMRKMKE
jgi:uncharacterized protein